MLTAAIAIWAACMTLAWIVAQWEATNWRKAADAWQEASNSWERTADMASKSRDEWQALCMAWENRFAIRRQSAGEPTRGNVKMTEGDEPEGG